MPVPESPAKRTVLFVIDALASRIVRPAVEAGILPNLARLCDAGQVNWNCWSIFPSITPAATASLVTGKYPSEHGISGAYWYDEETGHVNFFGDDVWVVLRKGFSEFFNDFLLRLNFGHLRGVTLFQQAHQAGLQTACINYLWYRGETRHPVEAPLIWNLLPGAETNTEVLGPTFLYLGDFVTTALPGADSPVEATGGVNNRFGFCDETTREVFRQLLAADALPDFTLAYFPDNDFRSHETSPGEALHVVREFDDFLGEFAQAYGGIEGLVQEYALFITGDHSQTDMIGPPEMGIDLSEPLSDFQLAEAGSPWQEGDEVMVCTNMRAAQIYLHPRAAKRFDEVLTACLTHPHVDQTIWHDGDNHFFVKTVEHGMVRFWHEAEGEPRALDQFGNRWKWEGDLAAVDGRLVEGRLEFGDYPNAFERVSTGFADKAGQIWLTAKPGYEFCIPGVQLHTGGSHGSLHHLDSTEPLIVAGAPEDVRIPEHVRSVDVATLIRRAMRIHA